MTTTITPPETDEQRSLDERVADACGQLNACYAALVDLVAEVDRHRCLARLGDPLDRAVDHLAHRLVRRARPLADRPRHRCRVAPEGL